MKRQQEDNEPSSEQLDLMKSRVAAEGINIDNNNNNNNNIDTTLTLTDL